MERETRAGKTFRAEQAMNLGAETEEAQASSALAPRFIGGEGAVSADHLFQNRKVRTLTLLGETWFWATEVCEVLQIRSPRQALTRLEPDEKGVTTVDTLGGAQTVNLVNQSGLYALIFKSRKPEARAFTRWVTKDVLPAIRKTGVYSRDGSSRQHSDAIVLPNPDYPTWYVVLACPGRQAQIRRTQWQSELAEKSQLDCEGLCYAIKSIEVWWQKVQQMLVVGGDPTGGFALNRLEPAIFQAAAVAN
jgi:prophage antirepressor-like protein